MPENDDSFKQRPDYSEELNAMSALARGDTSAMEIIVKKWQKPLINFFYRSVKSFQTAEDLAQNTFIKLYKAAGTYEPKAAFPTFLFFIARNILINNYRSTSKRKNETNDSELLNNIEDAKNDLSYKELENAFEEAVQELPENQRTAILLLQQQELSYEEISATMNTPIANIKTLIHRARKTLRDKLTIYLQK